MKIDFRLVLIVFVILVTMPMMINISNFAVQSQEFMSELTNKEMLGLISRFSMYYSQIITLSFFAFFLVYAIFKMKIEPFFVKFKDGKELK